MGPNFSKAVVETLARRAANWCSNPECRVLTVGPSDNPKKSVNIGEAAHIFGANPGSARYRAHMTDVSRCEITNGIWLCRNCHKLVDNDPLRFCAEVLFEWREIHEDHVVAQVGTQRDNIDLKLLNKELRNFADDNPRARRIVRDRPSHWEYSLTAELIRSYLEEPIRRWGDLKAGLYIRDFETIPEHEILGWAERKHTELGTIINATKQLYEDEMQEAWGQDGQRDEPQGDPIEIRHVCKLIQSICMRSIQWEEELYFIHVSPDFEDLLACMRGAWGSQLLEKLKKFPDLLDEVVAWAHANPGAKREFRQTTVLEPPQDWPERVEAELNRIAQKKGWL